MKKTLKRLISVFLVVTMLTGIFGGMNISFASAASGDFWYEVLSDGTAEITGYTGSASELTIPEKIDGYTVTSIGISAFRYSSSLTAITIPDSVTSIGGYAFENCVNLTSVTIGNSVTRIGSYVFRNCDSLTSVTIPDSVTSISDSAFYDCDSLTSVTIGNSVTIIDYYAFFGCDNLASITIPHSVTSIGYRSFFWCDSLKSVYYSGSEEQWKKISIGKHNENLLNAEIFYDSIESATIKYTSSGDGSISIQVFGRQAAQGQLVTLSGSLSDILANYTVSPDNGEKQGNQYTIDADTAVNSDIVISADNYRNYIIPKEVISDVRNELKGIDGIIFAYLSPDTKDGKSYISTIFGKRENGAYSFNELQRTNLNINKYVNYQIIVSAVDVGSNPTYYLAQDDNHKISSSDGVFSGELYSKFVPDKPVYAYVTSSSGTSTPVEINLDVIQADKDEQINKLLSSEEFSLVGALTSVTASDSGFLDKFELDLSDLKVPIGVSLEGNSLKVSLGLDLFGRENSTKDSSTTGIQWKKDSEWTNFVSDFKDFWIDNEEGSGKDKDVLEEFNRAKALKKKYDKGSYGIKSKTKGWDVNFLGYLEWEYQGGTWVFKEGLGSFNGEYKLSYSQQGFVWAIPEYTYFQANFEFGANGKAVKAAPVSEIPFDFDLSIKASPGLRVGGGLGIKDLISAGMWGKAELPLEINITDKHLTLDATGSFGFEAKFLYIFGTEKTILDGTLHLIDKYFGPSGTYSAMYAPLYKAQIESLESSDFKLEVTDRDYIDDTSQWLGEHKVMTRSSANAQSGVSFTTLQESVFEAPQSEIAVVGDKLLMTYVEDDASRDTYNRMRLMYSVYDSSTELWSEPQPVSDDGFNDVSPALVSDGENAYIAWQKITKKLTAEDCGTTEVLAENTEIFVSEFNSSTGKFENTRRITNDSVYDYAPAVGIKDGNPVVYYATCTDNNLIGTGNNKISKYENSSAVVAIGLNYIYQISASSDGSKASYIMDKDGSTEDSSDVDLFTVSGDTISLDSSISDGKYVNINGRETLLFTDTNNIYYYDEDGKLVTVLDESTMIADGIYPVNSEDGSVTIIWNVLNDDGTSDLYYVSNRDGDWGEKIKLTEQDRLLSSISAAYIDGCLMGVCGSTEILTDETNGQSNGSTDLKSFKLADFTDISVDIISSSESQLTAGENSPIDVIVTNNGTTAVDSVSFTVSDTLGTNKEITKKVNLASGVTETVTLDYPVPENYSETTLTVTAEPVYGVDVNSEDNSDSREIGKPDLFFENTQVQTVANGYLIETYLYNSSSAKAENIEISSSINTADSEKTIIGNTDSLTREGGVLVTYPVYTDELAFDENGLAYVYLMADSDSEDYYPDDNTEMIVLEKTSDTEDCSHIFSDWTVIKEATCTEDGTDERHCLICGYKETEILPKTGHEYVAVTVDPTCTQDGYKTYTCSNCGDVIIETIPKTGHDYISVTTAPTCTEDGYITHTCAVCGDVVIEMIPKLSHSYTAVVTEPTCNEEGYTTYTCTLCGDSYIDTFVPATGHLDTDADGICDICGEVLIQEDPSENCDCSCHKGGIIGFFWKIINFFHRIFGMDQYRYCECEIAHW